MEPFIIDNKEEIQGQLNHLGFKSGDKILDTAQPMYATQNPEPTGIQLYDPTVGSTLKGFQFFLDRVAQSNTWRLQSIRHSEFIRGKQSPTRYEEVFRMWRAGNEPFPHRQRMEWVVRRAAAITLAKNIFLQHEKPDSDFRVTTQDIQPMNKELETALQRLDFTPDPIMTQTAAYYNDITFFSTREKYTTATSDDVYALDLFFAVVTPEGSTPLQLEYLNASLHRDTPPGQYQHILAQHEYWQRDEGMPTKHKVLRDMEKLMNLKTGLVKARRIMDHADDTKLGRGLHQ